MNQPYGLGTGVVPPPGPPPAPPEWQQPGYPLSPVLPRQRRIWPALAVAGALLVTAVVAGGAGALVVRGGEAPATPADPAASAPSQVSAPARADATRALCTTLEREYPAIVAAIDERNIYNREPWTNPDLIRTSDKLAQVTALAANEIQRSMSDSLPASTSRAALEYVTALRAMSISESAQAPAKQLNGIASLYNSVVDPVLAVCGIKG
jgi:hypothetical protein